MELNPTPMYDLDGEVCNICDKPAVTRVSIEGTLLPVCARCKHLGTEVRHERPKPVAKIGRVQLRSEPEIQVKDGFGRLVTDARIKARLSTTELARQLAINEQDLIKIEQEKIRPTQTIAQKLERGLGVQLMATRDRPRFTEREERAPRPAQKTASEEPRGVTLGDVADIQ